MSMSKLTLSWAGGKPANFNFHFAFGEGYGCYCMLTYEDASGKEIHIKSWESEDESLDRATLIAESEASDWMSKQIIFNRVWTEVLAMPLEDKP